MPLFAGLHGFSQGTGGLANVGPENVETFLPQGLFPGNACNGFSGPVEVGDVVFEIDGEYTVGYGIQDGFIRRVGFDRQLMLHSFPCIRLDLWYCT